MYFTVPEGDRINEVLCVEVKEFIPLSFKSQHSIWAKPDATVHTRSEMESKKREPWVWHLSTQTESLNTCSHISVYYVFVWGVSTHRVDVAPDQVVFLWLKHQVISSEGNDTGL